jgi:hypothetical protein
MGKITAFFAMTVGIALLLSCSSSTAVRKKRNLPLNHYNDRPLEVRLFQEVNKKNFEMRALHHLGKPISFAIYLFGRHNRLVYLFHLFSWNH